MFVATKITFISAIVLTFPSILLAQDNLAPLQPCVQQLSAKADIKTAFVQASYIQGSIAYHLVTFYPSQPDGELNDGVIATESRNCQVLALYSTGASIPVTDTISLDVARTLTQTLVEHEISEIGGVEQYQSYLNRAAQEEGKLYLDEHRVWVLRQMGIILDPRIQIIDPTSIN